MPARANNARYVSKEELLQQADHVVLVLPYSKDTHHTIAAPELALMKPTATLTNIARGGIVEPREQRRDGHAPALDHTDHFFLRFARHVGGRAPAMRPELERALRGDLGVLLPQRSRGGIARVGK